MHKTWGRGVGCGLEKHHNQCTRLGVGGLGTRLLESMLLTISLISSFPHFLISAKYLPGHHVFKLVSRRILFTNIKHCTGVLYC